MKSQEKLFSKSFLSGARGRASETNLAGLLALHPANIFAPPKILDKKAAQGPRPLCIPPRRRHRVSKPTLRSPSLEPPPAYVLLFGYSILWPRGGEVLPDRTSGRAGREKPFARGAKGGVDGRGDPLSRLTAPALPKGEPTKDMLIIKASPFGRGGCPKGRRRGKIGEG